MVEGQGQIITLIGEAGDRIVFQELLPLVVKGKTEPVEISTLIGVTNDRRDEEFLHRLETYEAGFRKFRERDFTQAKILFSQFLEFYPDDALAKMYLERSLEYEKQPPDAAWNAVEVFKKK